MQAETPAPAMKMPASSVGWASAFAVLVVAFLALAIAVHHGLTQRLDDTVAAAMLEWRSPAWSSALLWWTRLHDPWVLGPLAAVLGAFALWCRQPRWGAAAVLAVPGVLIFNLLMKQWFARTRPEASDALVLLHTYSFPSGHAAGATAFHGLLCAYVISRGHRAGDSRLAVALTATSIAGVAVAMVALSRMVLGVHYLSDTVAGMLEGAAWLSLSLLVTRAAASASLRTP